MDHVKAYLYDAKGHDDEISLDDVDVEGLKENQLLWVNVHRRDEALLNTVTGKLNVKNARYAVDQKPLDESCHCAVCRRHTRAFIRHLYLSGEMLASILLTHHNVAFFLDTMKCVRQAIRSGQFAEFRREFTEQLQRGLE